MRWHFVENPRRDSVERGFASTRRKVDDATRDGNIRGDYGERKRRRKSGRAPRSGDVSLHKPLAPVMVSDSRLTLAPRRSRYRAIFPPSSPEVSGEFFNDPVSPYRRG